MSNAVAIAEPRPQIMAGGKLAAIIPQSMDEAYRMAKAVCMAGMAPKGMDTPEKAMIAIMRGLEVGLTPFQALDKIAVVNGRPTIWGDGAMALVRGSGICESIRETIDGEGDAMVASCRAKRKGEADPIIGVFSVADAKRAGLWGKQGPWQQFPKRMLQMRARAFALRDGFADVLGGLYLREEVEDNAPRQTQQPPAQPRSAGPPPPPPAPARVAIAPPPPAPAPVAPPATGPIDFDTFRTSLESATNDAELNAIYDREVTNRQPPLSTDEADEADSVLREAAAKFWTEGREA